MIKRRQTTEKERCANYLERRPGRPSALRWTADENGIVTLYRENTGMMNRLVQKLFRGPEVTQIHLDEMGSFVWQFLDGERNILLLGTLLQEQFGGRADPLYERLAEFLSILDSYRLIEWQKETKASD